ncbi:MAG: rhomboid family intramembrane serine protease [Candidatus Bathyarchaeota archaeon]|nr:MAG: rhomboid family intramembrane serine protease [Candidatus Bathyarchaeota archaeon]
MIPIRDENRSQTTPHVTRILLIINLALFIPLLSYLLWPRNLTVFQFVESLYSNFMMVPADILEGRNLHTLFTSMFLHADIFHVGGNMLFLYIFGDNVEDAFGHYRFLLFYLTCGLVADFAHIFSLTAPNELIIPTLGASGAISGVMGAYIVMYPRAKILTLMLFRIAYIVAIPAAIFLGFWFLLQVLYTSLGIGGGVAYWAHIGGFVSGVIFVFAFRKARAMKRVKFAKPRAS